MFSVRGSPVRLRKEVLQARWVLVVARRLKLQRIVEHSNINKLPLLCISEPPVKFHALGVRQLDLRHKVSRKRLKQNKEKQKQDRRVKAAMCWEQAPQARDKHLRIGRMGCVRAYLEFFQPLNKDWECYDTDIVVIKGL